MWFSIAILVYQRVFHVVKSASAAAFKVTTFTQQPFVMPWHWESASCQRTERQNAPGELIDCTQKKGDTIGLMMVNDG